MVRISDDFICPRVEDVRCSLKHCSFSDNAGQTPIRAEMRFEQGNPLGYKKFVAVFNMF